MALQVLCKQLVHSGVYPVLEGITTKQTQSRLGGEQLTNTSCSKMVEALKNLNRRKIAMNPIGVIILHRFTQDLHPMMEKMTESKQGQ